jgi:hypothetical protein
LRLALSSAIQKEKRSYTLVLFITLPEKCWPFAPGKLPLQLTDLVFGVNLVLHSSSDVSGGKVKLITNRDATNNQCDWSANGLELYKQQVNASAAEKAKQEIEQHAREIKEFQNRIRSPSVPSEEELAAIQFKQAGEEK